MIRVSLNAKLAISQFGVIVNYNTTSLKPEGLAECCRQQDMKKQFIQITSGWIPVSVLALFAVALIEGQARANLPDEIRAVPLPTVTTSVKVVLNADIVRKLEVLPLVVDSLLALPSDLEVSFDTRIISPIGNGEHSSRSNAE